MKSLSANVRLSSAFSPLSENPPCCAMRRASPFDLNMPACAATMNTGFPTHSALASVADFTSLKIVSSSSALLPSMEPPKRVCVAPSAV